MGDTTGISWTDATWNPVRGCSRVSEGCTNCYAERMATRFSGKGKPYEGLIKLLGKRHPDTDTAVTGTRGRWNGVVRMVPEHLADPLKWRDPRRIFVNSMSDLFHEHLADEQIDQVFGVMALAPQHTFQILTKRAQRMRAYLSDDNVWPRIECAARKTLFERKKVRIGGKVLIGPLPNIWLGVSVENQDAANERVPELLQTPAAVRFLSCEPLLGPIDLGCKRGVRTFNLHMRMGHERNSAIGWVIAGCESGPGARSCRVEWLRSIRDQCAAAGVPYFLKQAVATITLDRRNEAITFGEGSFGKGNVVELPYLDGVQHAAFPVRTALGA